MNPEEKLALVVSLESGRRAFLDSLADVSEALAARKPGADRWSILECAEHVAVAEEYLFSRIVAAEPSATPLTNSAREAAILKRGVDRTTRVPSPDVAKPAGRFLTLRDAIEHFTESRRRTIQFVIGCEQDLRSARTTHPLIGTVNSYETLLLMAVHPVRHAEQIREIRNIV